MELTLDSIEGSPYQNFLDYIRSEKTLKNYSIYLEKFMEVIPDSVFTTFLNEEPAIEIEQKTNQFIKLAQANIQITKQVIKAYVRELKVMFDKKEIAASALKGRLKPIKALFAANEIDFSWKVINKSLPKVGKTQDRAYTLEEVQTLLATADLTEKVIILLFVSAGFRVEAWDYFTWNDVLFFTNPDGSAKGLGVRVYAGDAEEYWTHGTPEAQKILLLYKEDWKVRFGKYPEKTDPLLASTKSLKITRLRMGGVRSRIVKLLRKTGVRPILQSSNDRHEVPADHGFRKYFNTMLRRAKVDYLDKEDMMGHDNGLENSYERYVEADFERFPEYQKAIPLLTISDEDRAKAELVLEKLKSDEIQKVNRLLVEKNEHLEKMAAENRELKSKGSITDQMKKIAEDAVKAASDNK